jgi:hypothetical protein
MPPLSYWISPGMLGSYGFGMVVGSMAEPSLAAVAVMLLASCTWSLACFLIDGRIRNAQ